MRITIDTEHQTATILCARCDTGIQVDYELGENPAFFRVQHRMLVRPKQPDLLRIAREGVPDELKDAVLEHETFHVHEVDTGKRQFTVGPSA